MRHYNINGSNPREIMEEYSGALVALKEAVRMMRRCTPHGRDYQGHPDPDAFAVDRKLHLDDLGTIADVIKSLEVHAIHASENIR